MLFQTFKSVLGTDLLSFYRPNIKRFLSPFEGVNIVPIMNRLTVEILNI
jgi:hypothetical protein